MRETRAFYTERNNYMSLDPDSSVTFTQLTLVHIKMQFDT